ncbi:MAG TPA: cyclic nucleotide-binding domain-containing protein [Candidatus Limnocylindrales bacterium]|nr:cyclic nucleotide-binding domain-containing protein [Candidatus Limnocylindrales bacterium]
MPDPVATQRRPGAGGLREAMANDGIRRLATSWTLGIAADSALTVVLLVVVFNLGGVVAAGLIGAVRMVPAVVAGMVSGAFVERYRGDRILVALGLVRALSAGLTALVIATAGNSRADHEATLAALFALAGVSATAAAPIRPTQITLMPALARSPRELVAANTAWSTGEALGAFGGPILAGVLMGASRHEVAAAAAALAFLVTALLSVGLRFEQARDAAGGAAAAGRGLRLADGLAAIRRRPVLGWTLVGVHGQVMTRGLLNALSVVAAIELLDMGQAGPGLLAAAIGLGGLVGAVLVLASARPDNLVRTQVIALVFWGAPIALVGVVPLTAVAMVAMVVLGVANAAYDVALFTTLQRGCPNDDRAPVMSVVEGAIGLGAVFGSLLAPVLLLALGTRGALIVAGSILPILAVVIHLRIGRGAPIAVVSEPLVELLRRVPAFEALPLTAVERLADGLEPFRAEPGTVLMAQGEPGDRFLVIATGEAEVEVDGQLTNRLGPGSGAGEIALLRRSPRTATVRTLTPVTGYSVDAATFLAAVAGPAAAAITERMAQANLQRGSIREPAGTRE